MTSVSIVTQDRDKDHTERQRSRDEWEQARRRYDRDRSDRQYRRRGSSSRSRSRSRSRDRAPPSRRRTRSRSPIHVTNHTNSEDPKMLNSRVFIGNLPTDKVGREDLENIYKKYGKILGNYYQYLYIILINYLQWWLVFQFVLVFVRVHIFQVIFYMKIELRVVLNVFYCLVMSCIWNFKKRTNIITPICT